MLRYSYNVMNRMSALRSADEVWPGTAIYPRLRLRQLASKPRCEKTKWGM
jgi:hypothetical protein